MSTATRTTTTNRHPRKAAADLKGRFRTLAQRIHAAFDGRSHTLGMTSCSQGEGVTTVARNLAAASVDVYGGRVLLIDANQQRPAVASSLGTSESPGLLDILAHDAAPQECISETCIPGLFVLPLGSAGVGGATLGCESGTRLMEAMHNDFSLVIVDLPPSGELDDRMLASHLLDGYVLVVEAERVRQQAANRIQEDFQRASAKLVGVVLNKRHFHIPEWLYKKL